jgi:hypothetical protein
MLKHESISDLPMTFKSFVDSVTNPMEECIEDLRLLARALATLQFGEGLTGIEGFGESKLSECKCDSAFLMKRRSL